MPDDWEQWIADVAHFWNIAPSIVWAMTWSETEWHLKEALRIRSATGTPNGQ
ncbi:hypothetical protein [Burkholderia vietnamiensis]|uniref:hypothetical protein n=1 Tax=Burkholderia vietnamiensis TaxID=60552 RepID=UPI001ABA227F|nr:hypothetical protein [Burkholderia vietnamiensis]